MKNDDDDKEHLILIKYIAKKIGASLDLPWDKSIGARLRWNTQVHSLEDWIQENGKH